MFEAFIIVLREGFESFLIVAITLAYLGRTGRRSLAVAAYAGTGAAVLASVAIGWVLMRGASLPLWEGILGLVALPLVVGLVVHMWRAGPRMRGEIERRIEASATRPATGSAAVGVFAFTALMVSREGMETALLLFQVREPRLLTGAALGLLGAIAMAWLWARVGHAIDLRRFFQVTGIFLLIFMVQIAITAFHELAEAGVLPDSQALHAATEPYGPEGIYGRWLALVMVGTPALWLAVWGGTLRTHRNLPADGVAAGRQIRTRSRCRSHNSFPYEALDEAPESESLPRARSGRHARRLR